MPHALQSIAYASILLVVSEMRNPLCRFVSRGALLAACLALAGCAGFQATRDDQLRSMQEFKGEKFSAPMRLPEANNALGEVTDAKFFLGRISFTIFAMADIGSLLRFEEMFALSGEGKENEAVEKYREKELSGGQGSAVAVSEDGYILTAAHVVTRPNILVMDAKFSAGHAPELRTGRARIVFADADADFALIKCERPIPKWLEIRLDRVPIGITLFSGGWKNEMGAGRLLEQHEFHSNTGHKYRKLHSSIPVLHGDSGSAVIDTSGRLLGVTTGMISGRFWRMSPKSEAVMLDAVELQKLIDEDRAKHR